MERLPVFLEQDCQELQCDDCNYCLLDEELDGAWGMYCKLAPELGKINEGENPIPPDWCPLLPHDAELTDTP